MKVIITAAFPKKINEWCTETVSEWGYKEYTFSVNEVVVIEPHTWAGITGSKIYLRNGSWHFTTKRILFIN
jgi:hypothetical protein